jgi:hypothetical protein
VKGLSGLEMSGRIKVKKMSEPSLKSINSRIGESCKKKAIGSSPGICKNLHIDSDEGVGV